MKVDALAQGLRVLACFTQAAPEWGVTDLSRALNLYKSRVHRLLATLSEAGLVVKDPASSKYRLGWRLFEWAAANDRHAVLKRIARPHLERLQQRTQGVALVRVLEDRYNVVIDYVDSERPVRLVERAGSRNPAHFGPAGRVLLAFADSETRRRLLGVRRLERFTTRSITDPKQFERDLTVVRRLGYAYGDQEAVVGIRAAAAPIFAPGGSVIAAVACAIAVHDLPDDRVSAYTQAVVECAGTITKALEQVGDPVPQKQRLRASRV